MRKVQNGAANLLRLGPGRPKDPPRAHRDQRVSTELHGPKWVGISAGKNRAQVVNHRVGGRRNERKQKINLQPLVYKGYESRDRQQKTNLKAILCLKAPNT